MTDTMNEITINEAQRDRILVSMDVVFFKLVF